MVWNVTQYFEDLPESEKTEYTLTPEGKFVVCLTPPQLSPEHLPEPKCVEYYPFPEPYGSRTLYGTLENPI